MNRKPSMRIQKELKMIKTDPIPGIEVNPNPEDFHLFSVYLKGPTETPFENGDFHCDLMLPPDYPMSPPKIIFNTKIFHPNIDKLGRVCLDILKNNWTPALQIRLVFFFGFFIFNLLR